MRIVGPLIALLVALSMAAAVLIYLEREAQPEWSYAPRDTVPDTVRIASGEPDPYHQRYYSESEGWTYYSLPLHRVGR